MFSAGRVQAVSVGQLRDVTFGGKLVTTGFFKTPVKGPVFAGKLGLLGDVQADLSVHGGLDKAVYVYALEHYQMWRDVLGETALPSGSFGENLTTEGLTEDNLHVGDVFRIGTMMLQVRQPRSPCFKLQMRFDRSDMVALFVQHNRPGWYGSVVSEGSLSAGDPIEIVSRAPEAISIAEVWKKSFHERATVTQQKRICGLEGLPEYWKERITRT